MEAKKQHITNAYTTADVRLPYFMNTYAITALVSQKYFKTFVVVQEYTYFIKTLKQNLYVYN